MKRSIGERIKATREDKGISMTSLAEKAGVSKSYISSIERGLQKNPSVQFIEKISKVLGITPEQLVQKDEEILFDKEWIDILKDAMQSEISKDEFREFIEFQRWKKTMDKNNH